MDRAIKEIVSGIVQRSVSIATQTTKELVLKVFLVLFFRKVDTIICYLLLLF